MLRLDMNLVYTIINLLILYAIVRKFLFAPVKKIIAAREAEIHKQYADAENVQTEARELKQQYEERLTLAEEEKRSILTDARSKAGDEYEKIVADARLEADKLLENAQKQADMEQQKRMQQAQRQVADLVVAAATKLVTSGQNAAADRELYNQFIAKTGEKCD